MAVYILKCSDSSYYVGVTNDLDRRIWEHNAGTNGKSYTFRRRPVELVFYEHFENAAHAIEFEKQVKGWRREKKEALIKREWHKLPDLSVNYTLRQATLQQATLRQATLRQATLRQATLRQAQSDSQAHNDNSKV